MPHNDDKPVMYSALEVAKLCGVVNQTAINWIRNNHIKAFNTPGGQFRVYPEDLVEFMRARNIQIPAELRLACKGGCVDSSLLIVDDDRGLNTVVAKYMERNVPGLSVYQAFDGFEAGSQMAERKPSCLILDLDLPGIDGFELCKKINENKNFGSPAIIVVTALENQEVEAQVRSLGVKQFFRKPLNLADLVQVVEESV